MSPTVQIIVPDEAYERYDPFIREKMPSIQAAGRLAVDGWKNDVPRERLWEP